MIIKRPKKKFWLFIVILFIGLPEVSVATSVAFEKLYPFSIYLYRAGLLTVSDYICIFIVLYTVLGTGRINFINCHFKNYFFVSFFYLMLGFLHNIFYVTNFNGFLYDVKCVLYMFTGLSVAQHLRFSSQKNMAAFLAMVIIFWFFSGVIDSNIISLLQLTPEYNSDIFGFYILLTVPASLMIGFVFILKKIHVKFSTKLWIILILTYTVASNVAALKLGLIYSYATSLMFLLLIRLDGLKSVRWSILGYLIAFVLLPAAIVLSQPVHLKSGGFQLRIAEIMRYVEILSDYPLGIFGHGLGASWVTNNSISHLGDVYAYGASASNDNDTRFIWHNSIAGNFYKFGIFGVILILIFFSKSISKYSKQLRKKYSSLVPFALFYKYIIFAFALVNLIGPGILKNLFAIWLLLGAFSIFFERILNEDLDPNA